MKREIHKKIGSRVLYHIGRRPAYPHPKVVGRGAPVGDDEDSWFDEDDVWRRPWLKEPVREAVFLTPNWFEVAVYHGVYGNVYAYRTPWWVIKESGGIHSFDRASEVLIPKRLWNHVTFLGKVCDSQVRVALVMRHPTYTAMLADETLFRRRGKKFLKKNDFLG